jgi:uncharacterized protein (UPF0332 family)
MDNNEVKDLSNYRMEQAKENLDEANILLKNRRFKGASNRAYYAIFHAIKSILALEQTDFKKHSSVIAYFNQKYISTEIFPKELGKNINLARLYREKSDYVDFYIVSKEEAQKQIETAKLMIGHAEKYIKEN